MVDLSTGYTGYKMDHPPPFSYCMRVIKNWTVGRPGNEAMDKDFSFKEFWLQACSYAIHAGPADYARKGFTQLR